MTSATRLGVALLVVVIWSLFLGLVGSADASWMWYVLVRDGELIWLNALTLLTPAFALLLALVLYREPLPPSGLVGVDIQTEIPFGRFVRGLHYWGASFTIVVVFLHLLRVFAMGAYKYPREMSWVVGVVLFLVVMLFGFTGYLLPWDQKAYWATVVGTHIAGTAPIVGDYLWRILQGGVEVGARTLGRFYAAHVLILPAVLYSLVLIHLSMVIYQGIGPTPRGPLARVR